MGQTTQGIITNVLTKKEIIELPKLLNESKLLFKSDSSWKWQDSEINETFLEEYWKRNEVWYNENLKIENPEIYKDAIIWRSEVSIRFLEPNLISIDTGWKWLSFMYNEEIKKQAIESTCIIAQILKADKILFTSSFGSGDTHQEKNGTHFGSLNKMIEAFTVAKRNFEIIETK